MAFVQVRRVNFLRIAALLPWMVAGMGCEAIDLWRPPASTPEQYKKGLIVFYPGTANLHIEAMGFYYGFREAGIDLAFEEERWSDYLETVLVSGDEVQPRITEKAKQEAARIAEFIRANPESPVTLVSYSGGAVCALQVAANMPADAPVDRVLLLSPGIWKGTDLTAALAGSRLGIVNHWSAVDPIPIVVSRVMGLADSTRLDPACTFGFDQKDPNLLEVPWSEEQAALGNNGGHLDFVINLPWIKEYVVPYLVLEKP